jgi:hypothetical protein
MDRSWAARCWTFVVVGAMLLACSTGRVASDPTGATSEAASSCTTNADCSGGQVCDPAKSKCADCVPSNDLCSVGQYCAGLRCAPGCKNAADCSGQNKTCDVATHTCFECLGDADCGAGQRCAGRICVQGCAPSAPCPSGQTCCGGACVNPSNNMDDCGACGVACPWHPHGIPACLAGSCTYACAAGFADCDGDVADGCEIDTRSDTAHCGSCSNACPIPPNAVATCTRSGCGYTCLAGYSDCNGLAADGCEVHSAVDNANCGACGVTCAAGAEQTAACVDGRCDKACVAGWGDCDGNAANGCETDLTTTTNCGSCGTTCTAPSYEVPVCSQGQCIQCFPYTKDCDKNPANGCETNITTISNCGACGNVCDVPPHEVGSCGAAGVCSAACVTDFGNANVWGNCDGNPANGCETKLDTPANCGACGHVCALTNAEMSWCDAYGDGCSVRCKAGFSDCDGNPANGCEPLYNLWRDADGDGYGDNNVLQYQVCTPPGNGWVTQGGDCADTNPDIHKDQTQWFSTPQPNSVIIPVFDYNCDGVVEGIWGSNACSNGNIPGAWYMCDNEVVYGSCTWNGSSCTFKAGWVFVNGKGGPTCEYQPTYMAGCFQSGSTCVPEYAAGSEWGCH